MRFLVLLGYMVLVFFIALPIFSVVVLTYMFEFGDKVFKKMKKTSDPKYRG